MPLIAWFLPVEIQKSTWRLKPPFWKFFRNGVQAALLLHVLLDKAQCFSVDFATRDSFQPTHFQFSHLQFSLL